MQQDDHIWLTIAGEGWAIRAIHRSIFYLWRGDFWSGTLELQTVDVADVDWDMYCDRAVKLLEEAFP
jgi:hypothetical protein